MKKKLTSAIIASALTIGVISSLSANAIVTFSNSSELENILKDYIEISTDYSLFNSNKSTAYINKDNSLLMFISENSANRIALTIDANTDFENVEKKILEIQPDAQIQYAYTPKKDGDGYEYMILVQGYEGKLLFNESLKKNITLEKSKAIYSSLSETEEIYEFGFYEKSYMPKYSRSYLTGYENKDKEKIKDYIIENDIKCHIGNELEAYNIADIGYIEDESARFYVIPNEKISPIEHYEIANQIYSNLGIAPCIDIPETMTITEDTFIDMANNTPGDANADETLDIADAVMIMQSISNPDEYQLTAQGRYNADIAGDNDGITVEDALAIQKKLTGLE